MTFGFANAPATFQRFVQKILHPVLGKCACVHIDDILVYSETAEEHVKHVQQVLQILKDNKLLAKLSKCDFFLPTKLNIWDISCQLTAFVLICPKLK
jgi:hypothetical protein